MSDSQSRLEGMLRYLGAAYYQAVRGEGTASDVVRPPWHGGRERAKAEARTVAGLMTSPAITIRPDALLGEAARLMNARRVRRLPVIEGAVRRGGSGAVAAAGSAARALAEGAGQP